jgi:hypothetical protein
LTSISRIEVSTTSEGHPRLIFDEVVGFVKLKGVEARLWESPILSRLGYVKQLGIASNVFPGASHTRLSHSLGTMFYADRLASSFENASQGKNGDPQFRDKIRVAALLHDIGHPALSHNLELWFGDVFNDAVSNRSILSGYVPEEQLQKHPVAIEAGSRFEPFGPNQDPFHNSVASWYLIRRSPIAEILTSEGFDPEEIASIVAGIHGGPAVRSVYDQILDSGLDADKLDYLQRDGYATGVRYGTFDIEQILKSVGQHENQLCVDEDAIQACIHFTLVRYLWYSQIICNKNLVVFEQMVRFVYEALVLNKMVPSPVEVLHMMKGVSEGNEQRTDEWLAFTDEGIIRRMERMRRRLKKGEKVDESVLSRDLLLDYIERIVWKREALPNIARVDYVEGAKWQGKHPRGERYSIFHNWVLTDRSEDYNAHRIIMKSDHVKLIKDEGDETPILIKTSPHDLEPIPLQQHYGCILQQFSGDNQIGLHMSRVYSVPKLYDELVKKWDSIPESAQ